MLLNGETDIEHSLRVKMVVAFHDLLSDFIFLAKMKLTIYI